MLPGHYHTLAHFTSRLGRFTSVLVAMALIASVGIYLYASFTGKNLVELISSWPAGWAELSRCSPVGSIDLKRELDFSKNQRVVEYETLAKDAEQRITEGRWWFDPVKRSYVVESNGAITSYSLVEPEGRSCILIRGTPGAPNLEESWFSIPETSAIKADGARVLIVKEQRLPSSHRQDKTQAGHR